MCNLNKISTIKIAGQTLAEQLYVDVLRRDTMFRCFRFS